MVTMSDDSTPDDKLMHTPTSPFLKRGQQLQTDEEVILELASQPIEIDEKVIVEPEIETLSVETDEEILLAGEGDKEFLQYALQYKDHPNQMGHDFKFLTRLAARQAHKSGDITPAEHRMIVDLIKNPVRMRDGKPYDAWQAFETQTHTAMSKAGLSKCRRTLWQVVLVWFKENWPEILKLLLTVLTCLDLSSVPKPKRHRRDH